MTYYSPHSRLSSPNSTSSDEVVVVSESPPLKVKAYQEMPPASKKRRLSYAKVLYDYLKNASMTSSSPSLTLDAGGKGGQATPTSSITSSFSSSSPLKQCEQSPRQLQKLKSDSQPAQDSTREGGQGNTSGKGSEVPNTPTRGQFELEELSMAVVSGNGDESVDVGEAEELLCDYEKQRLQNITDNQEMVKEPSGSGSEDSSSEDFGREDSGSDPDWRPSPIPEGNENVCDDCDTLHHGGCPVHGPLEPLDSTGQDQASLAHTSLPVPSPLTIKPSSIPGAGLGVFATQFIPKRVQVGPYEGKRVDKKDMGDLKNAEYAWEVCHNNEFYFIDGSDPTHSNWMRFVNCARNEDEQNMSAFQYQGHIYYRTFRNLYPGVELLVWYGDQYARDLGISTLREGTCVTHQCQGCGDRFVEERSLQLHLKHAPLCAQANPKTHTCGKCHHQFQQLEELQQHIEKHNSGDKPHKCEHCGKCFRKRCLLQQHLRTHTGDKPYTCEHCGKCFSTNGSLRRHRQTQHTGDKPYKCKHCEKCFSRNSSLQQHLRTHTRDKPYKCKHCGECFRQNGNLQEHIRMHTGDKPYKCEHCGKCFTTNGNLQQHLRAHTGDKPYKCKHCGKCFGWNSNLQQHLRTTHTEQV